MNFCHKICLVKIFSLTSQNYDPLLSKVWLTTPTSFKFLCGGANGMQDLFHMKL